MAKKNKKDKEAKKARAELKSKKSQGKAAEKEKKKSKKLLGAEEDDDLDIEQVLANFKKEQEQFEKVVVENIDRPSRRINPSMIANPIHGKSELIMFGGEHTIQSTSTTHFLMIWLSFLRTTSNGRESHLKTPQCPDHLQPWLVTPVV